MRQIRTIRQSLGDEVTKTLVHALIGSRLDYCSSVLVGVTEHTLSELQRMHNAAARLIAGAQKYDRMTPVL